LLCFGHWVALNPRSVRRVIADANHENMKDALPALNARLVELDDRVPDTTCRQGFHRHA